RLREGGQSVAAPKGAPPPLPDRSLREPEQLANLGQPEQLERLLVIVLSVHRGRLSALRPVRGPAAAPLAPLVSVRLHRQRLSEPATEFPLQWVERCRSGRVPTSGPRTPSTARTTTNSQTTATR